MAELLALIAFVASIAFFIWFGATLNSIKGSLERVAAHAARQTGLLASMANKTSEPGVEPEIPIGKAARSCPFCARNIVAESINCPHCGEILKRR
jgi:hypothetical protein